MIDIVVIGGGGHARVVISILKKTQRYRILGYTDLEDRGDLLGSRFLGCDDNLAEIKDKYPSCAAVLGIGAIGEDDILKRNRIFNLVKSMDFAVPHIISPDAVINEAVEIGDGTVLMDGVVINSGTVIGDCVIVNTRCSLDHDCVIGDFVHIGPGATLCGMISVGNGTLVGAGAVVCPGRSIAEGCTIGAGAVVAEDCKEAGTYVGVPARRMTCVESYS